jgi:general secretion pathway protein C
MLFVIAALVLPLAAPVADKGLPLAAPIVDKGLSAPPADLAAVGIVVSRDPARSVALLRAGGRTRAVSVGESAFGGRVAAIVPGTVTVEFEGQRMDLRLSADTPPSVLAHAPTPAPTADPGTRVLERREVERRLGEEASRILAETTLMPALDGGHVAGFTLTRVPEGSLLTDAGLRAGDVLTSINDTPIDSMATLVALYPRLQNETTLRAVVLRNGQPVSLTVNLR